MSKFSKSKKTVRNKIEQHLAKELFGLNQRYHSFSKVKFEHMVIDACNPHIRIGYPESAAKMASKDLMKKYISNPKNTLNQLQLLEYTNREKKKQRS